MVPYIPIFGNQAAGDHKVGTGILKTPLGKKTVGAVPVQDAIKGCQRNGMGVALFRLAVQ